MKQRVKDMENEAAKLRDMQAEVEKSMHPEEGESQEKIDVKQKRKNNTKYPIKKIKKQSIVVQFMLAM